MIHYPKQSLFKSILFLALSITTFASAQNAKPLKLKVGAYKFERLAALFDGRVKIKGCDATFVKMGIGDMNTNVFHGPQDLDVTEIGLHPFMLAYANDNFRDYTLLPIFPLRLFRHKSIFIGTDSGIKTPKDLKGKTIATPGYSSTSLTWIRGILQDEYGITPQDVKWVTSSKDSSAKEAGKISKNEQMIPKGINIQSGTKGKDESELLLSGEADALFHAAEPKAYVQGNPEISRLFADSRAVEQAYYKKTGIFPIMHAIAIKTSLLKEHPWLAQAVFDAYRESKAMTYSYMRKLGWADDMLPWYGQELQNTQALMEKNFYSYGLNKANRKTLNTLFRYSYEQGLSSRELTIDELFDPLGHNFRELK
ncbi:MAG: hypothetical protein COB07_07375 [Sulfurovum sp.]|nr:MAG: hypothetical protein COB07_07375 [Sulfurovum sp.]